MNKKNKFVKCPRFECAVPLVPKMEVVNHLECNVAVFYMYIFSYASYLLCNPFDCCSFAFVFHQRLKFMSFI